MAKKKFVRDDVLDKAIALFWKNGFHASSMQQVSACTGLKPGSIYLEFGSKEGLFCDALKRYSELSLKMIRTCLDNAESTGLGICEIFEKFILDAEQTDYCSCFIIKTQLELAAAGNSLYMHASEMLGKVEALYRTYLEKEYDEETSRAHAACLMIHFFGVRVYGYQKGSSEILRQSLRTGLPWLPWDNQ